MIDWENPKDSITSHFTVHDAIYLPQWDRLANENDGLNDIIKENIGILLKDMEEIRNYFNKPIIVHVTYRPAEYNKLVGGAPNSAHAKGLACDFNIQGVDCDQARKDILDNNLLELLGMRMENKEGANWVHLDLYPPKPNRFFIP